MKCQPRRDNPCQMNMGSQHRHLDVQVMSWSRIYHSIFLVGRDSNNQTLLDPKGDPDTYPTNRFPFNSIHSLCLVAALQALLTRHALSATVGHCGHRTAQASLNNREAASSFLSIKQPTAWRILSLRHRQRPLALLWKCPTIIHVCPFQPRAADTDHRDKQSTSRKGASETPTGRYARQDSSYERQ